MAVPGEVRCVGGCDEWFPANLDACPGCGRPVDWSGSDLLDVNLREVRAEDHEDGEKIVDDQALHTGAPRTRYGGR